MRGELMSISEVGKLAWGEEMRGRLEGSWEPGGRAGLEGSWLGGKAELEGSWPTGLEGSWPGGETGLEGSWPGGKAGDRTFPSVEVSMSSEEEGEAILTTRLLPAKT